MSSTQRLYGITCTGGGVTNCTAVGGSGTILRTTAGANAWSISYASISDYFGVTLYGVTCPSATVCFSVGSSGRTVKLTQ